MDSAVLGGDSSSANVSFTVIRTETSSDMIKIVLSGEVLLLSRPIYFKFLPVYPSFPYQLSPEQISDLLYAVRCFAAEKAALVYINRAEHSVFQLEQKLAKKGFTYEEIRPALRYLCGLFLVDDTRFAEAWLHTRSLQKPEGKNRLFMELRKRGVSDAIAWKVLADYFAVTDENALCERVCRKYIQKGYTREKLLCALQRKGFSYFVIRRTLAAVFSL